MTIGQFACVVAGTAINPKLVVVAVAVVPRAAIGASRTGTAVEFTSRAASGFKGVGLLRGNSSGGDSGHDGGQGERCKLHSDLLVGVDKQQEQLT